MRLHRDQIKLADHAIAGLDGQIADRAGWWPRELGLLHSVPGFGDVVSAAWLAEIGPAPHRWFPSHDKLASWATLCPGNNISARKCKSGRTGDAGTYINRTGDAGTHIKPMLIQAAWAAIQVRGRLQVRYRRLVRRFGGDKNPGAKRTPAPRVTVPAGGTRTPCCNEAPEHEQPRQRERGTTPAPSELVRTRAPSPAPSPVANRRQTRNRAKHNQ